MASTEFESAVASVKELTEDPGNDVKLKLYALYKQATEGDVSGKRPGFTDFVGRAKYDAWAETVRDGRGGRREPVHRDRPGPHRPLTQRRAAEPAPFPPRRG